MFKKIEIQISKLKDFKNPKLKLEQYSTPSEVIKEFLMFIEKDLIELSKKRIKILDCCAGTGFLGISIALFLKEIGVNDFEIHFLEKDKEAIEILKENLQSININFNYKIINRDFIEDEISENYDLVVMNPPFGVQGKIKDKEFLDRALEISKKVVSFHTANSLKFLEKNYNIEDYIIVKFPIKAQFWFHNKKRKDIEVVIVKIIPKHINESQLNKN